MKKIKLVLVALGIASSLSANVGPPTVTDTVTGSAGAWTLDFTVNNNTNQGLYFFGVLGGTNVGTPANWDAADYIWSNAVYGGSNTVYSTDWITSGVAGPIAPGASLSGFDVLFTTSAAPANVPWFAYAYYGYTPGGTLYTGAGNFYSDYNPGFESYASSATPEPSAFLPLALGLIALAARTRRGRPARS